MPLTRSRNIRWRLRSATAETETTNATAAAWSDPRSSARRYGFTSPCAGSSICATKWVKIRNHATIHSCKRAEWLCRLRARKMPTSTATVTTVGIFSSSVIIDKEARTHSMSNWEKNQAVRGYKGNQGHKQQVPNAFATFTVD